jgi:uncharacterized membrane protein
MSNPLWKSFLSRFLYVSAWVGIAAVQVLLLEFYCGGSDDRLSFFILYDSLICNGLQAICLLVLWFPIQYYRNIVSIPLFILFHALLFVLSMAIWLGVGYLGMRMVGEGEPLYSEFFVHLLPVRILFGASVYILFTLIYYLLLTGSAIKGQEQAVEEAATQTGAAPVEKLTRISVRKHKEIRFIPVGEIHYIEANGDYVMIHTATDKFLKDRSMKYWETHLPEDVFVRIHRSFIVHIEWIAKIELYGKESYKVLMKNGEGLKTSSAGYKVLRERMMV